MSKYITFPSLTKNLAKFQGICADPSTECNSGLFVLRKAQTGWQSCPLTMILSKSGKVALQDSLTIFLRSQNQRLYCSAGRFLTHEVVAGEGQDLQPLRFVLVVQFVQLLVVLFRETAVARHVHDQQQLTFRILIHIYHFTVNVFR